LDAFRTVFGSPEAPKNVAFFGRFSVPERTIFWTFLLVENVDFLVGFPIQKSVDFRSQKAAKNARFSTQKAAAFQHEKQQFFGAKVARFIVAPARDFDARN